MNRMTKINPRDIQEELALKAILQNLIGFFRWAISNRPMPMANIQPISMPQILLKYNETR